MAALGAVVRELGADAEDVTLRRPTLDEVFLALTASHAPGAASPPGAAPPTGAASPPGAAPHAPGAAPPPGAASPFAASVRRP